MFVNYIQNGRGFGPVGERLSSIGYDTGYMRPFIDDDNKACVTIKTGRTETRNSADGKVICNKHGVPVRFPETETVYVSDLANSGRAPTINATTLRKDEWIELDSAVLTVARARLQGWTDLASRNSLNINGMGKSLLEHETMSDPGTAIMDMDGTTPGRDDAALFQLEAVPLPITHSDFSFSERKLAESRNTGTPLDTVRAEAAGRRVAEMVEKHLIGIIAAWGPYGTVSNYGDSPKVYGYTTHGNRSTYSSVTTPTGENADETVSDVLAMRDTAFGNNFFGPFMVYHSNDWDQYMDNDYGITAGSSYGFAPNQTLRNRIRQIEGIVDCKRLDLWTPSSSYQLLLVQMTSDVAQAVTGMALNTVQWDEYGGLRKHFKVMTIMVPRIRANYNDVTGIVHGTTS